MFATRCRILGLIGFCALLVIWARVAHLQLVLGPWYRATRAEAEVRIRAIPAPRGAIRAADGTVLAIDRCDADLAVHYRYLERPIDEAWLTGQARERLARRERRDPARVAQAASELRGEIEAGWRALAELTGLSDTELGRRAQAVQHRVDRVVESVNRRRRERWQAEARNTSDGVAPSESVHSLSASVWKHLCDWLSDAPPARSAEPQPVTVLEQDWYYPLVEAISPEMLLEFTAHAERYPGVRLEQQVRRSYPHGDLACAVVGYVEPSGPVAGDPWDGHNASLSGRSAVEGFYDSQLRGEPGHVREQVGLGAGPPRVLGGRPPRPGAEVALTLELELQRFAEALLDRQLSQRTNDAGQPCHAQSGAIVVLNVHTGAVLAGAVAPRFDLNTAARPGSDAALELAGRDDAPLFNRLVQMTLPPGSTFKPVVALAALDRGIDPRVPFICRGYLHHPDQFRCLVYRHHGVGHDAVNMTDALVRSCNVYFFRLADEIGPDAIVRWAAAFGFGERSGIDLFGEEPGNLPGRTAPARGPRSSWSDGERLGLATGQGSLAATPVQVAVMMAAIANGGLRVVPHLRSDAFQPPRPIAGLVAGRDRSLALVRDALEQVVADPRGTGHHHAYLPEIDLAGKTGTAQSGSPDGDHAWFAGYVPARKPEFAIVVVLEHAGSGGQAAGPLARELVRHMIELGHLSPTDSARASEVAGNDPPRR